MLQIWHEQIIIHYSMATTELTTDYLRDITLHLVDKIKHLIEQKRLRSKKWLKTNQVKEMLSVSSGTLNALRTDGVIPFSRVGGSIYYDYSDIIKLMKETKVTNR